MSQLFDSTQITDDSVKEAVGSLTEEQDEALRWILNRMYNEYAMQRVTGQAGTGKSYLLGVLVSTIRHLTSFGTHVRLCAPTHEAVHVMETHCREAAERDPMVQFQTIQSALDLQVRWDEGERKLLKDYSFGGWEPDLCRQGGVIIVDESSMLGQRDREFIEEATEKAEEELCWLFVGDEGQLPAVKDKPAHLLRDLPGPTLESVVRQAEGSAILDAARICRNRKGWESQVLRPADGEELRAVSDPQALIREAAKSFESSDGLYDARMVTFRNDRAAWWNEQISRELGFEREWEEGMRVMSKGQWRAEDTREDDNSAGYCPRAAGDMHSSEVFEVTSASRASGRVGAVDDQDVEGTELKLWQLTLEPAHGQDLVRVPVVASQSLEDYEEALSERRERGKAQGGSAWVPYYVLQEAVLAPSGSAGAGLTKAYAGSCHSAQGVTCGKVYLDLEDILSAPAGDYQKRPLTYVGLTRAANECVVYRP